MHSPDPGIQCADIRITRTEAHGQLFQRDHLVYPSRQEFAAAEIAIRSREIGVGGDRPLKFGYGLWTSSLNTQDIPFYIMRECIARRCGQRSLDQLVCACKVGGHGVGLLAEDTGY